MVCLPIQTGDENGKGNICVSRIFTQAITRLNVVNRDPGNTEVTSTRRSMSGPDPWLGKDDVSITGRICPKTSLELLKKTGPPAAGLDLLIWRSMTGMK
jgi:hypothetical protein